MTDSEEYKGHTIEICNDNDISAPWDDWDMEEKLVYWHRRYCIGHVDGRKEYGDPDDFLRTLANVSENRKSKYSLLELAERKAIILPVHMYDHSGVTISTDSFSCPWDSGQLGYIYITLEQVRKEWNVKRVSPALRAKMIKRLDGTINTFDQYLTGDVYGFQIKDSDGDELNSCYGFYGSDHEASGLMVMARDFIDSIEPVEMT